MENNRKDKGYCIEELVELGDKLHDCSSAIVLTLIKNSDETETCFGSASGRRSDLTKLIMDVLENQPELEAILTEAVILKKMVNVSRVLDNLKGGSRE